MLNVTDHYCISPATSKGGFSCHPGDLLRKCHLCHGSCKSQKRGARPPSLHYKTVRNIFWQWQRIYTMSYCYERTWADMALAHSIVVRCTRLDDYNTMYIHLSSRTLTCSIFNVVSFLPLTPRGFVWLHWLGDTFPIFPMWFFGFSYQAAHTFFHCTFWFVGTSSFCWRSSCFGLGWGGPFTRSLLWAVAGVPSPLLG